MRHDSSYVLYWLLADVNRFYLLNDFDAMVQISSVLSIGAVRWPRCRRHRDHLRQARNTLVPSVGLDVGGTEIT